MSPSVLGALWAAVCASGHRLSWRVPDILARVVLFNACALVVDCDTVRQAHLAECIFSDSVLRRLRLWGGHGGLDLR